MKDLENLIKYLKEVEKIDYLIKMLHFERDTIAPKKSMDYLISVSTELEMKEFEMTTSDEYITLIKNLINSSDFENLKEEEKRYILKLEEDYNLFKKIPKDFFEEYTELKNKSIDKWQEAKKQNNYLIFKPYLEKIIPMTKKYYEIMFPESKNLYDSMLDMYEKGIKSKLIDKLFETLKKELIPIVKKLKEKEISFKDREYSESELYEMARYLLEYIGFDNDRGALGVYPHGYESKFMNDDIRIVFSKNKSLLDHAATIIHEGGHGIFDQNIKELAKYPTYNIDKYALHESQSRFYENFLGRNINFWIPIFEDIKKMMRIDCSLEEFVEGLNYAKTSYIRTEADELTYCLHIILRYEIEKDLFTGKITADELTEVWRKKTKEYLGLDITKDSDGVLQDVHWADGSFGYFPSYLLGTIFAGMLLETMNNEIGDVDNLLKEGRIKEITKYLNEKIHAFGGAYNVNEVAKRICNEELTVKPLIKYFKNKYENN